ncbi:hypothetical protein BT93_D0742 [Corymbia citriodora subsp. variegata]|nr:hypothetical protein BT93_D0742 [Corymbia citriodora subsp. variegata]
MRHKHKSNKRPVITMNPLPHSGPTTTNVMASSRETKEQEPSAPRSALANQSRRLSRSRESSALAQASRQAVPLPCSEDWEQVQCGDFEALVHEQSKQGPSSNW